MIIAECEQDTIVRIEEPTSGEVIRAKTVYLRGGASLTDCTVYADRLISISNKDIKECRLHIGERVQCYDTKIVDSELTATGEGLKIHDSAFKDSSIDGRDAENVWVYRADMLNVYISAPNTLRIRQSGLEGSGLSVSSIVLTRSLFTNVGLSIEGPKALALHITGSTIAGGRISAGDLGIVDIIDSVVRPKLLDYEAIRSLDFHDSTLRLHGQQGASGTYKGDSYALLQREGQLHVWVKHYQGPLADLHTSERRDLYTHIQHVADDLKNHQH